MWEVFRHFKGMLYLKLGVAKHSETMESFVSYLALYDNPSGRHWIRPQKMFEGLHEEKGIVRFEKIGTLEVCQPSLIPELLTFGHDAWGEGKPLSEFVELYNTSRNHLRGTRYVFRNNSGQAMSGLNLLRISDEIFGIASVATNPGDRKKGSAEILIRGVIGLQEFLLHAKTFALFSEVDKSYYEKFGFCALPTEHQKHLPSVAMVRGRSNNFDWCSDYF